MEVRKMGIDADTTAALHNITELSTARRELCEKITHGKRTPDQDAAYEKLEEAFTAAIKAEAKNL